MYLLLEMTFDGMGEGEEEEEKHTEEIAGSATRVVVLKRRDGATRRAIVPTILRVRNIILSCSREFFATSCPVDGRT